MAAPDRNGSRNGAARRDTGRGAGAAGSGHGNGARGTGPVLPAKREQRIERSPSSVVRQAGEVRGRTRVTPPPVTRDESWSHTADRALPLGPVSPLDDEIVVVELADMTDITVHVPMVERIELAPPSPTATPFAPPFVALGDITYDRAPAALDRVVAPTEPPTERTPVIGAPAVTEVVPAAVAEPPAALAVRPRRSRLRRRHRVRKVSRVVRRVDAWSVLKVSVIFYALTFLVLLVAGVLLWNLAQSTGTVANIEGFIRELFSLKNFKIDGRRVYRASWPIGVFLVVAGTGVNVTAAVMFNLITDLVGGVRVTVLEEEVRVLESSRTRRRVGRTTLTGPAAPAPARSDDGVSAAGVVGPEAD